MNKNYLRQYKTGSDPCYDQAMKPIRELEPGVLPTFRLFIGIQLAITALGVAMHWLIVPLQLQPGMATLAVLSVVEPALLLLYLSVPALRRIFRSFFLPIAIIWAAAGPILDPYINLYSIQDHSPEILGQLVLWRQIILLLIPLVVVSWQYTMRHVFLFCIMTAVLNILLLSRTVVFQEMIPHSLLGILVVQMAIFILIGHMIVKLMNVQQEQRQRLTEANERLAHYAITLEQLTISRERNRMARELHDVLAHTLSGVAVELEGTRSVLRLDVERANTMLTHSLQNIRAGLSETRRALKELRAKPLEDLGLALAVRDLATSCASRCNLEIDLDIKEGLDTYPAEIQQCVYRITQEALANVATHAQAQHAQVVLRRDADLLLLTIRDDGCGFCLDSLQEGAQYGLLGMRERAEMIGGCLLVESQVGRGTKVCFSYRGNR